MHGLLLVSLFVLCIETCAHLYRYHGCVTIAPKVSSIKQPFFLMLINSVGQQCGWSRTKKVNLHPTISEASAGRLRSSGAGTICGFAQSGLAVDTGC